MIEIAVPLNETEALMLRSRNAVVSVFAGLRKGRHSHSPVPELIEQAIRIVQLRTEIVVEAMIVLADEEHRGQRREAEFGIRLAPQTARRAISMHRFRLPG